VLALPSPGGCTSLDRQATYIVATYIAATYIAGAFPRRVARPAHDAPLDHNDT
jgi:hypothetical protein